MPVKAKWQRLEGETMRKLTTREKVGLGILGVAVVFSAFYLLIWPLISGWMEAYAELNDKRNRLEMAEKLAQMEGAMKLLEMRVQRELGVADQPIISDEMIKKISEKFSIGNEEGKKDINKATFLDLMKVEGLDSATANEIIRYRNMLGGFQSLDQLKELRSSVFEEGDEQAAIIGRVSQIAKESGIRKIDQLGVRPIVSTKPIPISQKTKLNLVKELYAAELELQMKSIENDRPIKSHLVFPLLPTQLPKELKLRVARKIMETGNPLTKEEYEGIISEYLAEIPSEEEQPLPMEEEIANALNELAGGVTSEGGEEGSPQNKPQMERVNSQEALKLLMRYNQEVKAKRNDLLALITGIPASYKPRVYYVDMTFKTKLESLVKFILSLQQSSKWLEPRGLRIGVADEKQGILGVRLTIIANAL
ncbi:TPA: helix-hairpin-helix domain-containing protein [Candidatus Poribacteria bacterium]|nr:helix-hairpin-helix domain-containing protein [Candidatus Poribacteria bacterium]HEX30297.1 helix-hairpin-helix domain-containing protein [Candidatus Poribacteria bacterium]